MGHGIETNRDFQYGQVMAWHGLTKVEPVLKREHFPDIQPMPLYFMDSEGNMQSLPEPWHCAIAADDSLPCGSPFNVDTYTLFSPAQAWDYVHEVLQGTGFTVESLGMLKNRSIWFVSTRLVELESLSTIPGDSSKHRFMFNFSGGLNRQFSPSCELSDIREVCWNTVSASRASGEVLFRKKATKNFKTRLDQAKAEIEKAVGMAAVFAQAMGELSTKSCTVSRAERIYTGFIAPENREEKGKGLSTRVKNIVGELSELFADGMGNRGESLLDVFNGFTELRTRGSKEGTKSRLSQFESSEFGLFADQKAEFFQVLTDENRLEETETRGGKLLLANG